MKRKVIPFPCSAVCSNVRSKVLPPPVQLLATEKSSQSQPIVPTDDKELLLPSLHYLSLKLVSEEAVNELESNRPEGLVSWEILSPGLIELIIQSGKKEGFGVRAWPFRVGGQGLIYDGFSAPIAVRCGIPIAHSHIDDAGFVDADFWKDDNDIRFDPTIINIAKRLVNFLHKCENITGAERDRRWKESEVHCYEKVSVINKYKLLALSSDLVDCKGKMKPEWLHPRFQCSHINQWAKSVEEISPGIFCFDLFTPEFCDLLIAEFDSFEATTLPRRRPNTMNKFGLILNEIGLEPVMSDLLKRFIEPLCSQLFPTEKVAMGLDHHHTFVVVYSQTGDKGLDMHHDASEVTVNVCLGRDFTGSGLVFCGEAGKPDHRKHRHTYSHQKGKAIIHLGRQRHGADNISSGERINLIMWARSSAFRCAAVNGTISPDGFPRQAEDGVPDRICLSRTNDDDYTQQLHRIVAQKSN